MLKLNVKLNLFTIQICNSTYIIDNGSVTFCKGYWIWLYMTLDILCEYFSTWIIIRNCIFQMWSAFRTLVMVTIICTWSTRFGEIQNKGNSTTYFHFEGIHQNISHKRFSHCVCPCYSLKNSLYQRFFQIFS